MKNGRDRCKLLGLVLTVWWVSTVIILPSYSSVSASTVVSVLSKFQGVNIFEGCNGTCLSPDPQVAAGPNHVAEMVNFVIRVYGKDGTVLQTRTLPSLFNAGTDTLQDPKLLYDTQSQRWFASATDITANTEKVAASTSTDPTSGPWNVATLKPAPGSCPDQPLLGVSNDKVIVSANDYSPSCALPYLGAQYWVVNKNDLVNGVSKPGLFTSTIDPTTGSIYPVQSLSSTDAEYMVSTGLNSTSTSRQATSSMITLYTVTGQPGNTPVTTISQALALSASLTAPPYAAAPGVPGLLDTSSIRVQDAKLRDGKLWLGLNDSCIPNGDSSIRSCARIIRLDTATPSVQRNFYISAVGIDYFYPALAIDGQGNIGIVFGFSSATDYPSLAVTRHSETDSPESWAPPQTIAVGSALVYNGHYGDYFGAATDPSDPTVAWTAGQYHNSSIGISCPLSSCWSTYIVKIRTTPNLTTSYTYSRQSDNLRSPVTFTANPLGGTPPYTYNWDFGDHTAATGNPITHTFHKAGSYTINLTTIDSAGQQFSASQSVPVTITPNQEFQLDWADYDNTGIVNIIDQTSISPYYGKTCSSLTGTDRSSCTYWDWNLDGKIGIVDIAHFSYWYDFQTDAGAGRPQYALDLKWSGCTMLTGDSYNYCTARGL